MVISQAEYKTNLAWNCVCGEQRSFCGGGGGNSYLPRIYCAYNALVCPKEKKNIYFFHLFIFLLFFQYAEVFGLLNSCSLRAYKPTDYPLDVNE